MVPPPPVPEAPLLLEWPGQPPEPCSTQPQAYARDQHKHLLTPGPNVYTYSCQGLANTCSCRGSANTCSCRGSAHTSCRGLAHTCSCRGPAHSPARARDLMYTPVHAGDRNTHLLRLGTGTHLLLPAPGMHTQEPPWPSSRLGTSLPPPVTPVQWPWGVKLQAAGPLITGFSPGNIPRSSWGRRP